MKNFTYKYKNKAGEIVEQKLKAQNMGQAKSFLQRKKIEYISLNQEGGGFFNQLFEDKSVEADDLVAFSQLFAGCIRSGLTLKESLTLLCKQISNKMLKDCLENIVIDLEGGASISDAFAKYDKIFPKFYPMLLKAGEASGDLASVLEYLANYLEKITNLKKQIVSLITYPAVVMVIGGGMLAVILIFVAPTFKDVFLSTGMVLPVPTVVLFAISDILFNYGAIIAIIVGTIVSSIYFTYKNLTLRKKYHYFFLIMPIFGKVIKEVALLRFLKGFDVLVNNDVPILQSLQVLEEGTTNLYLKDLITEMRRDVSKGLPIATVLMTQTDIISPMVCYSISMGEKAGNLGSSLTRIGNFMDKEIIFTMKKLSSRLDPLLTFGLGITVLFVALAIYLPIFDMMTNVG